MSVRYTIFIDYALEDLATNDPTDHSGTRENIRVSLRSMFLEKTLFQAVTVSSGIAAYQVVLRLALFIVFPIIAFPFIFLSTMSPLDKVISTIIALSFGLIQFYGTIAFRKFFKKTYKA